MQFAFALASTLLICFAVLGAFDGFYLHLVRYKLYQHQESRAEHWMHTVRTLLFPAVLYFLYLSNAPTAFYIGIVLTGLDLLVVGADAYLEKDSRRFMGGLPRWEYIIHLFVNGFHFATIAVFLLIKLRLTENGVTLASDFTGVKSYSTFIWIVENLLPGAVLIATLHLLLMLPRPASFFNALTTRIKCC
jgi:hypothetical protein